MYRGYDSPTPKKPVMCGRYQLIERIGFGGMAEVFKARLPGPAGFQKTVVVKRILPRLLDEKLVVQMFIEEAKIAAAADHDNIARVFELGQTDDGKYFIVMEYISGVDLELLLRGAAQRSLRAPIWFALQVVSDVLEALSFVHALVDDDGRPRNVIHRDATPSNIFVSYLGKVKLTDFGVADFVGKAPTTVAGQLKGKLAYMSPEQLNARMLDQRSDIFSMGVVLWEVLTHQRLFGGLNEMQAMLAICDGDRKPPSAIQLDVPPYVDAVVLKALAADRDERYGTAAEFQSAILDCLHLMRPTVRQSEMRHIVDVLMGRASPDQETTIRPMTPAQAARDPGMSFLMKLDKSERKKLAADLDAAMEKSIPIASEQETENIEDTHSAKAATSDVLDSETIDASDDPRALGEVAALRSMLAEKKKKRTQSTDDTTQAMRMPEHLFWVRSPGGAALGPHPYGRAREILAEAGLEGTPIAISVDQRHWMKLADFCARSGQDLAHDGTAPPSNVTVVGSLAQRSMAAVFGIIARDRPTGTLSVANTDTGEWYEIQVIVGRPVNVVTNVESMQLPDILEDRGILTEDQVAELLFGVVKTGRSWEDVAKSGGLPVLDRKTFMGTRLTALFGWVKADYTFNLNLVPQMPAIAASLLALLPKAVLGAFSVDELKKRLGPRLQKGLEPSWRFADALDELGLDEGERRVVDRLKSSKPIVQLAAAEPQDARRLLAFAYALSEADLLLEALET
jgi:serine/threonine-protein kinase